MNLMFIDSPPEIQFRFKYACNLHSHLHKHFRNYFFPEIAVTDENRSFYLTSCAYIPDGLIKHCGEPDDYEYIILTDNTHGTVWQQGGKIMGIYGKVPFSEEQILKLTGFYEANRIKYQYRKKGFIL